MAAAKPQRHLHLLARGAPLPELRTWRDESRRERLDAWLWRNEVLLGHLAVGAICGVLGYLLRAARG